jgi:hypothetical protein
MAGLSDDDVKALVDAEIRQSVGYFGGKLAQMRQKAEFYFLGEAKGDLSPPEIEGRSSVVDTTVRNTILWMQPALIKIFCAGDNVVEFAPTADGDEEKAKLATDYLNYLFYKQNPGYQIVSTWFTDALLQKNGLLKAWWDDRDIEAREEYSGLDDVALATLLDDDEVTPIEHSQYPDEEDAEQRQQALAHLGQQLQQAQQAMQAMPPQPPGMPPQGPAAAVQGLQQQIAQIEAMPPKMLHDVTVKRVKSGGKLCVENVPPEEFLISRKAKSIKDGPCGHRVRRTMSDLKAMGYKNLDQIQSEPEAQGMNAEMVERATWDDEQPYSHQEASSDPSLREVWLIEWYQRMDADGDGIAEWRKIVKAGNVLLENEECDGPPFVSITPIPLPHRFFGMSIADLAMEPQRIQTSLLRAQLDNLYLSVNGRHFAVEGQVNLDDLLTSRPGGVVRVKNAGAVGPIDAPTQDGRGAMELMQWFQDFTENSTGWTRYSQGGDSDALNKTATGINVITNRGDARIELIARQFAETGFTDLFRLIMKLVCQHQKKSTVIRLGDKWADIDPREWTNQFDLNINVGLGTGNKDQQVQHLMMLHQQQGAGLQIGITTPKNMYNSAVKLTDLLGFKGAEKFWTDPEDPNAPKPPNPAQGQMQGQMQLEQMKLQAQGQTEQMKIQAQAQNAQLQAQATAQVEQMKAQLQAQLAEADRQHEAQLEQAKAQMQMQVDINRQQAEAAQRQQELQQEAQLAQMQQQIDQAKHEAEQAMTLEIEKIKARAQIIVAKIGAGTGESPDEMAGETALFADAAPSPADEIRAQLASALEGFQQAIQTINRPKQIVRDGNGRAVGIQ